MPSTNSWDNGPTEGCNYWSDHGCIGNPSDKPYYIDSDGVDHYPFQNPNEWLKGNQPSVVKKKPDLRITRIEESDVIGETRNIVYRIKNQGNAEAGPSYARLYIDGLYIEKNYV